MNIKSLLLSLPALVFTVAGMAQNVSMSPSRLYFKSAPGESKKQTVHITNNSTERQAFTVSFSDFAAPGVDGKTQLLKPGESENSLSKFVSASPSFFELAPGQSQDVAVILDLPDLPESNKAKWGTMMLKLAKERTEANASESNGVGMGIVETFQFVVHLFQTPPSVTLKQAEITEFRESSMPEDSVRTLSLITKNTGEAIIDCATYLEYSNIHTGYEMRSKPSAFTVLPGGSRRIYFTIPADLPKGQYTITAVVDSGNRETVQAAEMDVEIK